MIRASKYPTLRLLWLLVAAWLWLASASARAQGVELSALQLQRSEGALVMDFSARLTLPRAVEDALQRGVPMYFVAQATVLRNRWYWRDERITRVSRSWRVAFQPLTNTWRVSLGGFNQSHNSLAEALNAISRTSGWRLAELSQLDADSHHYVEFSYRLDNSQLPSPMQIALGGTAEWAIGAERTVRFD